MPSPKKGVTHHLAQSGLLYQGRAINVLIIGHGWDLELLDLITVWP